MSPFIVYKRMISRFCTQLLSIFSLAAVSLMPAGSAEPVPPALPAGVEVTHPQGSPLRSALRPVPESAIFKMDGWYLWDPSVIKVGDT